MSPTGEVKVVIGYPSLTRKQVRDSLESRWLCRFTVSIKQLYNHKPLVNSLRGKFTCLLKGRACCASLTDYDAERIRMKQYGTACHGLQLQRMAEVIMITVISRDTFGRNMSH